MLHKQASDLRNELSRLQAMQPAATAGADTSVSQQAFLSQMDELESAYQKQVEDLESQLDGFKAENLTLCMEVQDIGKEAQKEVQLVCSSDVVDHTILTHQCGAGVTKFEHATFVCQSLIMLNTSYHSGFTCHLCMKRNAACRSHSSKMIYV